MASSGKEGLEIYDRDGPFAVVVSDFAMPEMNGAEFLGELRQRGSSAVTMLLTGVANFEEVSEVVSSGGIFRLLNKPCSSEKLKENLEQALRQYNLIRAEKELLEETLNGSVSALISLFSASKPLFFGRAQRVKKLAVKLADRLGMDDIWRIELATVFSYLGYLTLPDNELEKDLQRRRGFPGSPNDHEWISRICGGYPFPYSSDQESVQDCFSFGRR